MDFFTNQLHGFAVALSPWNLLYAFVGDARDGDRGAAGPGPATTIALLLPVTYTTGSDSGGHLAGRGSITGPCTEGRRRRSS